MPTNLMQTTVWPIVPLGSVVKFLSGGTPSMAEAKYWNGDIPWVSSGEMTQRKIYSTELRVTEDGASEGSKRIPAGTVLVVVRGMSLAKEFRVAITARDVTFNQDLKALLPSKKLLPEFLFYYLRSQNHPIRDSASESAHGTKKLDTQVLEEWPVPLPPSPVQKKMVAILSAYDDLIENNRRRIALLEKMAEEIYREWFVRLRFPGHEKVKVIKGVPAGWRAVQFTDICEFQKGKTPDQTFLESQDGLLPYITVEFIEGKNTGYVLKKRNSIVCENGDVLMLMDGARSGLVFRGKKGIVGSTFARVAVEPLYRDVVYEFLRATREHIVSNNTGSAIPHANKEFIHRLMMFLPESENLIEKFNDYYRSLFEQSLNLVRQNELLSRSRDALLPRLISSKLSVENLDIQFPPSMEESAHEH